MTRRGFFKILAGLVAGVYAAFVPKAKATMYILPTENDVEKFSKAEFRPEKRSEDEYLWHKHPDRTWHWIYISCDNGKQARFKCFEKEKI